MSLIIIAIICLGIYYLYGFITDQETKRQRKNDPKRKESLEFYTTQANLFLQYKNYLYDNIDNFKKIPSRESIRKKIENDFPYYGNGISGWGITGDFFKFRLLYIYDKSEDDVKKLLEQIRVGFETNEIQIDNLKLDFTVSIGCSLEYGESLDEMIQKADIGLYDAKNSGRNKVRYR